MGTIKWRSRVVKAMKKEPSLEDYLDAYQHRPQSGAGKELAALEDFNFGGCICL